MNVDGVGRKVMRRKEDGRERGIEVERAKKVCLKWDDHRAAPRHVGAWGGRRRSPMSHHVADIPNNVAK